MQARVAAGRCRMTGDLLHSAYESTAEDMRYGIGLMADADRRITPIIAVRYENWPPDKLEVGLVDQRRGLERVLGSLLLHPLPGDGPQLIIDQWQQSIGGPLVAFAGLYKELGEIGNSEMWRAGKATRDLRPQEPAREISADTKGVAGRGTN